MVQLPNSWKNQRNLKIVFNPEYCLTEIIFWRIKADKFSLIGNVLMNLNEFNIFNVCHMPGICQSVLSKPFHKLIRLMDAIQWIASGGYDPMNSI